MSASLPKVCYLRGSYLNSFEAGYLRHLKSAYDLSLACPRSHRYPLDPLRSEFTVLTLPCLDYFNGHLPRTLRHIPIPNPLKMMGREDTLRNWQAPLKGFDLLHLPEQTFYFTWQILAQPSPPAGQKVIVTQDEINPFWYHARRGQNNRAALVRQKANFFIARTERARLALVIEGVPPEKIAVVGHGIDLNRFDPETEPTVPAPEMLTQTPTDRPLILQVGNLKWTKGVLSSIDALAALRRELGPNRCPYLVFVGEGPERPMMEKRIKLLDLGAHVFLAGNRPHAELPHWYRRATLVTLPSISTRTVLEQFGIALLEAMSMHKPVVTTHCGGIDEVVGDAAVLTQPNDTLRLSQAWQSVLLNPSLATSLAAKGRQRVEEHFSAEIIADKIARVYEQVLS
jgi:glycosyltransferase involved in cell wall biosynthesis